MSENSGAESGSSEQDAVTGVISVDVLLPSGETTILTVDKSIPIMDFIVQLTRAHKLSTADHILSVVSEDNGRTVEYASGQLIGPLLLQRGRKRLSLLSKAAVKKEQERIMEERRSAAKFEATSRVLVNLPRGVKAVYRVKRDLSVGEIFRMACSDKSLDATKYTVCLPGVSQQPVSMHTTLAECGKNEISIVELPASSKGDAVKSSVAPSQQLAREEQQVRRVPEPARGSINGQAQLPQLLPPAARAPRKKYSAPLPPPMARQQVGDVEPALTREHQTSPEAVAPQPGNNIPPGDPAQHDSMLDSSSCQPALLVHSHSVQSSDSGNRFDLSSLSSLGKESVDQMESEMPCRSETTDVPCHSVVSDSKVFVEGDASTNEATSSGEPNSEATSGAVILKKKNKVRAPALPVDREVTAL